MPKFGLLMSYTVDYVFEVEADDREAAEDEFDRLAEAGRLPDPVAIDHKGWETMAVEQLRG